MVDLRHGYPLFGQASLRRRKAEERVKKRTGSRDNGKAGKLFSLPIVHPVVTTFFIQILVVQVLNETVDSGKFNQKNYLVKVRLLL